MRVRCLLCGGRFKAILATHLVRMHGFDPDHPVEEYKARYDPVHTRSRPTTQKLLSSVAARYDREGRTWTRVRIREAILSRYAMGQSVQSHQVRREDSGLEDAARGHFGSWADAVRACGLDYGSIRAYRKWTRDALIQELRARKASGASLRERTVMIDSPALRGAARRIFGTWEQALAAAGL